MTKKGGKEENKEHNGQLEEEFNYFRTILLRLNDENFDGQITVLGELRENLDILNFYNDAEQLLSQDISIIQNCVSRRILALNGRGEDDEIRMIRDCLSCLSNKFNERFGEAKDDDDISDVDTINSLSTASVDTNVGSHQV